MGQRPILNWRYLLQLFDPDVLPPSSICELGATNRAGAGIVEIYIYASLRNRFGKVAGIREALHEVEAAQFKLDRLIAHFDDPALRRSVDKIYEVVVYALFQTITLHLNATITLRVDPLQIEILRDFHRFAKLVLGVDPDHPEIRQPARLYRVGTANAADAGLDMWANFGPAIQVKHITLSADQVGEIMERQGADQVVIVCKRAEQETIEIVMEQMGLDGRIRGFITESDLLEWYGLCCGPRYASSLGVDLVVELRKQFDLEFPVTNLAEIDRFFSERGYTMDRLVGDWIPNPEA